MSEARGFTATFGKYKTPIAGTLLTIGSLLWLSNPGPQFIRHGFIELFYPAMPGFIIMVTGIGILCLHLIQLSKYKFKFLTYLGETPLFMYIIHEFFLGGVSIIFKNKQNLLVITILFLTIIALMSLLGKYIKNKKYNFPSSYVIELFFGRNQIQLKK